MRLAAIIKPATAQRYLLPGWAGTQRYLLSEMAAVLLKRNKLRQT
jgi:hypothetical protein